ncbi:hypothetical protein TNIN_9191 [Trichonephila inaurata madagascariensis]|uniref:Uncharacterized protein n=1 Tax=Trichonephila inaurata madagascariensis TaxID=2747483 RepID=A0A8X6I303_9ARAC|nr:hypothetical protein TNIN_9191 [Trichonephila inaurata madagascariensis]
MPMPEERSRPSRQSRHSAVTAFVSRKQSQRMEDLPADTARQQPEQSQRTMTPRQKYTPELQKIPIFPETKAYHTQTQTAGAGAWRRTEDKVWSSPHAGCRSPTPDKVETPITAAQSE